MDWSALSSPALESIAKYLSTVDDLRSFGGVCRAWRTAAKQPNVWLDTCHVKFTYNDFIRQHTLDKTLLQGTPFVYVASSRVLDITPQSMPYLRSVTIHVDLTPTTLLDQYSELQRHIALPLEQLCAQIRHLVTVCPHVTSLHVSADQQDYVTDMLHACKQWKLSRQLTVHGSITYAAGAGVIDVIRSWQPNVLRLDIFKGVNVAALAACLPSSVTVVDCGATGWHTDPVPLPATQIGNALVELRMQVPGNTDEWMHQLLSQCVVLQRLHLVNTNAQIRCDWLTALPALHQLEVLECGSMITSPTDVGWWSSLLRSCRNITELQLGLPLTIMAELLDDLTLLPRCHTLSLICSTDLITRPILRRPSITHLTWTQSFSHQPALPAATFTDMITSAFPSLHSLTLWHAFRVTGAPGVMATSMQLHPRWSTTLTELHITSGEINASDIAAILLCSNLVQLHLSRCLRTADVDDDVCVAIQSLSRCCPQLQQLTITDLFVDQLFWHISTLASFNAMIDAISSLQLRKLELCVDYAVLMMAESWSLLVQCKSLTHLHFNTRAHGIKPVVERVQDVMMSTLLRHEMPQLMVNVYHIRTWPGAQHVA